MDGSKLRIIQSYEQGLAPEGSDKRGPTVHTNLLTQRCLVVLVLLFFFTSLGDDVSLRTDLSSLFVKPLNFFTFGTS